MNNENNQGNVTNYVAPQQQVQPVQPVTEPKKKIKSAFFNIIANKVKK